MSRLKLLDFGIFVVHKVVNISFHFREFIHVTRGEPLARIGLVFLQLIFHWYVLNNPSSINTRIVSTFLLVPVS
jgi:hypothetical protein